LRRSLLDESCQFTCQIPALRILRPPEKHPTVAYLGEPLADVSLLAVLGVLGSIRTLVFDDEHSTIIQLGNKVRVETVSRCGQAASVAKRMSAAIAPFASNTGSPSR
jgi:hypothetical protein